MKVIAISGTNYLSKRLHFDFKTKYKICIAQLQVEDELSKTKSKIKYCVDTAQANKCNLIIFPEDLYFGILRGSELDFNLTKFKYYNTFFKELSLVNLIDIIAPTFPYKVGIKFLIHHSTILVANF